MLWITTNCGKLLRRWEWQTSWPASWDICMQLKKQQLELDLEKDWFQIGKEVYQGCVLSTCLFKLYAECIMWNAWLDETQAGIKKARRNINNLRYADDTTLRAENEKEIKSLLMKLKEESEKPGLKLNIQNLRSCTLEGIMSRITETEDKTSEVEDKMVEINEAERKKESKEMRTTSGTSGTMWNAPTFESQESQKKTKRKAMRSYLRR